jgi:hypothetical protein
MYRRHMETVYDRCPYCDADNAAKRRRCPNCGRLMVKSDYSGDAAQTTSGSDAADTNHRRSLYTSPSSFGEWFKQWIRKRWYIALVLIFFTHAATQFVGDLFTTSCQVGKTTAAWLIFFFIVYAIYKNQD